MNRPFWQLPRGVSRGTWDYIRSPRIAEDYEVFLKGNSLFELDIKFIDQYLPPVGTPPYVSADSAPHLQSTRPEKQCAPLIADFGCGTGRVAKKLVPLGYRVMNIDLSQFMLSETRGDLRSQPRVPWDSNFCIRGNMAELTFLRPKIIDLAICLFSSLGMIRDRLNRIAFLSSVRESLHSDAQLIVHVHNRYHSLFDPGGCMWLMMSGLRSFTSKADFGDRVYNYRGLPSMFLHIYSRREIQKELCEAGFSNVTLFPIQSAGNDLMRRGSWFSTIRAGGFFAVARR